MQTPVAHVGKNLRLLRQRQALTQAQLAEKAGVTAATVARCERNERQPNMSTLAKLAKALGVPPAELIEEEK